jgi:PPK2 family polyphosphate:nucleotide phosphotransferase
MESIILHPMKIDPERFRVKPGEKVHLKKWPTRIRRFYKTKLKYQQVLADHVERMSNAQGLLYADGRYSLLIILQAMDAAGKDGVIKHVMSGVNPQGCQVFSFKAPSAEELRHDFLWRTTRSLPERGRIGLFNRSYYEEVLVVRVHPSILEAESLPEEVLKDRAIWKKRYRSITDMERHLSANGTRILKFYLHLSKEEQRKRLLARLQDPDKNWKFSQSDMKERALWKEYTDAYEACLESTSTEEAPWFVIPADDKPNARLIVSKIILKTLEGLPIEAPKVPKARRQELAVIHRQLAAG